MRDCTAPAQACSITFEASQRMGRNGAEQSLIFRLIQDSSPVSEETDLMLTDFPIRMREGPPRHVVVGEKDKLQNHTRGYKLPYPPCSPTPVSGLALGFASGVDRLCLEWSWIFIRGFDGDTKPANKDNYIDLETFLGT